MPGSEEVRYAPGAEPTKRLAPNQLYRLTVERAGASLLEGLGLPAIIGYSLWRPNALAEAWELIASTPYAWAVSPRPAPDTKVAILDVKIKTSVPTAATVQQMVEGINLKLGKWSHIYGVDDLMQSQLPSDAERQQALTEAKESGAGKTPLARAAEGFGASFKRASRLAFFGVAILAIAAGVVVFNKFRKAVQ